MTPLLCRLLRRHRGRVGYLANRGRFFLGERQTGPYWMCDNCGEVKAWWSL